ncbi:class III bacteriocin [Paenibacillus sp. P26]|nr:class III bacteriocin [Paenibacillus sp. P26]UUZ95245.1 class III bacteriocin [Paenibacillus sp. P25]
MIGVTVLRFPELYSDMVILIMEVSMMFQVQVRNFMKRQLKVLASVVLSVLMFGMSVLPVLAASPEKTVNASATLAYNLKGLKHNAAVQKAYIASTYVYVTQRSGEHAIFPDCSSTEAMPHTWMK